MEYALFESAVTRKGEISLHNLVNLSLDTPKGYYNAALSRLLREAPSQRVVVFDGTSYPDFSSLIEAIEPDLIGWVVIGSRTDINPNVNATLECTLIFAEGALCVQPHWSAYKEIRAGELISTLVRPLRNAGLLSRTSIETENGAWRDQPVLEDYSTDELASALFSLSGYPNYSSKEIAKLAKSGEK